MLFLPFVATGYYKIWKKEKKVISLTEEIDVFLLKNISPPPLQCSIVYSIVMQYTI